MDEDAALQASLPAAHLVGCKSTAVSCGKLIFLHTLPTSWAGIAQSLWRLATGWTIRGSNPGWGARFTAPVQTGPEAHPTSYNNGYRVFPGGKAAGAWR